MKHTITMRDVCPALSRELGEKAGDVFGWYCNAYGVGMEDEAPASVLYEVFGLTKGELLIREALLMCKRFPSKLPPSDVYAELLAGYKLLFYGGKDTAETDREARDRIGNATGAEVLRVFNTAPAEALSPLRIEI